MKVVDLAKELNVLYTDLKEVLSKLKIPARSAKAKLDPQSIDMVKRYIQDRKKKEVEEKKTREDYK